MQLKEKAPRPERRSLRDRRYTSQKCRTSRSSSRPGGGGLDDRDVRHYSAHVLISPCSRNREVAAPAAARAGARTLLSRRAQLRERPPRKRIRRAKLLAAATRVSCCAA